MMGRCELDEALKSRSGMDTMWQTRLQQRALRTDRENKVDALLMRDEELADALEWAPHRLQ